MFLPLLLSLLPLPFFIQAQKSATGGPCLQNNTRLQPGTYELTGDCGPTDYCAAGGTCAPKGCRRDTFPFGYTANDTLPDKCLPGTFCPDEGDACQKQLPVGSPCQLARDDECAPPSNATEFANFPNNANGSVCLNFVCTYANVTENNDCVIENTVYVAFSGTTQFPFVVSRGNCVPGLYCDAVTTKCLQTKAFGVNCTADKECTSDNCLPNNTCGLSPDAPAHFPIWVYAVVGFGIFGGMAFTLIALFFVHRRARDEDREKRTQYWREQTAFRQNILQMRESARSGYHRDPNDRDRKSVV